MLHIFTLTRRRTDPVCSNSPSAPIPWQPSEAVVAEADKRVSTAMAAAAAVAAAAVCRSTTGQTSPGLLLCSELVGKMSIRSRRFVSLILFAAVQLSHK